MRAREGFHLIDVVSHSNIAAMVLDGSGEAALRDASAATFAAAYLPFLGGFAGYRQIITEVADSGYKGFAILEG